MQFEFVCDSEESFFTNMFSGFIYSSENICMLSGERRIITHLLFRRRWRDDLLTSSDIRGIKPSDVVLTLVRSRKIQITSPNVTSLDLKLQQGTFSFAVCCWFWRPLWTKADVQTEEPLLSCRGTGLSSAIERVLIYDPDKCGSQN